jgi:IstB-like ATP binding protein
MSTGPAHDPYETRGRLQGAAASDEFARWRDLPPRLHPVELPPLSSDLIRLLFRLRLRYIRQAGPGVLARAREEGWDHTRVLKVLLAEEAAGRDRSTREVHRKAARLPSGKTFDAWDPKASAIPGAAQWALRSLDWIGRAENLVLVGPIGDGQESLRRGDRPHRDRSRPPCQLVHTREPDRHDRPFPDRCFDRQGRRADRSLRTRRRRRHRPAAGWH